jgi:hypothetical protein
MFRRILPLIVLLAVPLTRASAKGIDVSVAAGYENDRGKLLLQLADSKGRLPFLLSGNTVFWGNTNTLHQLEITWFDEGAGQRAVQVLVSGSENIVGQTVPVVMSDDLATVRCGDRLSDEFKKVSEARRARLEADIRAGKIALKTLPDLRQPLYLLQVKDTGEYVYITEPRFNFHGDFEVFVGGAKHMRRIPLESKDAGWKTVQPGVFRFASGGGVYLPIAIDLLNSKDGQRGSPTLIRGKNAKIEALQRVNMAREDIIKKFGLRSPPGVALRAPCGPVRTQGFAGER